MSIIAGHISEVLMATRSTQQKHSSTINNTATTTSSVSLMNEGVRVGAASITDEPEKTPAMIKLDLVPTTYYLLPITYYPIIYTYNLRFVKSLLSTDRYAYAKRSFFRLWEPQPPDSSADCRAANSARQVRQSGAGSRRSGPRGARLFGN